MPAGRFWPNSGDTSIPTSPASFPAFSDNSTSIFSWRTFLPLLRIWVPSSGQQLGTWPKLNQLELPFRQEWNYDRKHLELIKPGNYTLKSFAWSSRCHVPLVALTLASSWVLGASPFSDNETIVCFLEATGLLCLVTELPLHRWGNQSPGLGSNVEAMTPLLETVTSPLPSAGPSHCSLRFHVIQVRKPSSGQLSSLFLFSGYQPIFISLLFWNLSWCTVLHNSKTHSYIPSPDNRSFQGRRSFPFVLWQHLAPVGFLSCHLLLEREWDLDSWWDESPSMHAMHNISLACSDAFLDKKAIENVSLRAHLVPFCELNGTAHASPPGKQAMGVEQSKLGSALLCGLPR